MPRSEARTTILLYERFGIWAMLRLSLPYPPFQLEIFELNSHLRRILCKISSTSSIRFVHPFLRDRQKYPLPSPPRSYCPVSSRVRSGRERNSSIRIRRRSLQRNRRLLNLLHFFGSGHTMYGRGSFFLICSLFVMLWEVTGYCHATRLDITRQKSLLCS